MRSIFENFQVWEVIIGRHKNFLLLRSDGIFTNAVEGFAVNLGKIFEDEIVSVKFQNANDTVIGLDDIGNNYEGQIPKKSARKIKALLPDTATNVLFPTFFFGNFRDSSAEYHTETTVLPHGRTE